jgi:hypothetical protein
MQVHEEGLIYKTLVTFVSLASLYVEFSAESLCNGCASKLAHRAWQIDCVLVSHTVAKLGRRARFSS